MVIVDIDEKGRMTIPEEIGFRGSRAAVIPAGSFLVVVPIFGGPCYSVGGWLDSKLDVRALKEAADKRAAEDAVDRTRKRKQL